MNPENDKSNNQPLANEKIDEIIDKAIKNAEVRRELSEEDLDKVVGAGGRLMGINPPIDKDKLI